MVCLSYIITAGGRKKRFWPFVMVLSLLTSGCRQSGTSEVQEVYLSGNTMGTTWSLKIADDQAVNKEEVMSLIQGRLDELEQLFSNWRPDSEVERFNASVSTDWQPVSSELAEIALLAQEISRDTDGAFDITLAPLVKLWGFAGGTTLKETPSDQAIHDVKKQVGWQKLEIRQQPPSLRKADTAVSMNVSALAEGYAADDLTEMLRQYGLSNFLLDIGGEIYAAGRRGDGSRWQVGVQRPGSDKKERELATQVELENQALATSGVYQQFLEINGQRYPHILDGRTGRPVTHVVESVSVIAEKCLTADAWATGLLILGFNGRELAEQKTLSALFLEGQPTTKP